MSEARLLVPQASGPSTEVPLADETRIGRSPANDVVLDDPSVSRRHALVRRIAERDYIVIDLGSANGTSVNGEILSVPARLTNGDVVRIGASSLTFEQERLPDAGGDGFEEGGATRAERGPREIPLLGTGPAMSEVFRLIERSAGSTLPVLIQGETGTGKELVARGIHGAGARASGPFIVVGCAALRDDDLVVRAGSGGLASFHGAEGGTLFLDEVADLAPGVQAKLLRVLEETKTAPVGGAAAGSDVRVLSATNHDLASEVENGRFRRDLFYRLAGLTIHAPALREHREDIPLLCERLLAAAAHRHGRRIRRIADDALAALVRYEWPGNVRELEHEIERAALLAGESERVGLEHLSPAVTRDSTGSPVPSATPGPAAAAEPRTDGGVSVVATRRSQSENVFRHDGEFWTVAHAGQEVHLKDNKGLHHIAQLLREPWREIAVQDLAREDEDGSVAASRPGPESSVAGVEVTSSLGDAGPALDAQAKADYRRRLREVREELEEAERDNDPGRAERARAEMEFLVQQLSAAVGLGGRDRPSGSHAERARLLVTQRIKAAMKRVAESHPALGEHLAATIRTGYRCAYVPDPGLRIEWDA